MQTHTYATKLAHQRIETAHQLQRCIDERVHDEQFRLELVDKRLEAEVVEINLAKERMETEKLCFEEAGKRVSEQNRALMVTNQRQIAEQLLRQIAFDKWKSEKQEIYSMEPSKEMAHGFLMAHQADNASNQYRLN